MKISFQAKSSGKNPYTVDFLLDENKMSVFCDCQSGVFGKLCKHKTELIAGDKSRLFDESDEDKLDEVCDLIDSSSELSSLAAYIIEQEKIIKQEQSKLKRIKKNLEEALRKGFSISENPF